MITPVEFMKAAPYARARRVANLEMRGKATASEVQWLYENPLMWLRALSRIKAETHRAITKSASDLNDLKPAAGTHASQEYLNLHRAWLDKRTVRFHFLGIIEDKMEEVKSLLGAEHFTARITVGDLIAAFIEFDDLVDDDEVSVIQAKAQYWIRKLSQK
jgi:hypothetical protein